MAPTKQKKEIKQQNLMVYQLNNVLDELKDVETKIFCTRGSRIIHIKLQSRKTRK